MGHDHVWTRKWQFFFTFRANSSFAEVFHSSKQNKSKETPWVSLPFFVWKKKKNVCRITLPKSLLDPMDVALSDAAWCSTCMLNTQLQLFGVLPAFQEWAGAFLVYTKILSVIASMGFFQWLFKMLPRLANLETVTLTYGKNSCCVLFEDLGVSLAWFNVSFATDCCGGASGKAFYV